MDKCVAVVLAGGKGKRMNAGMAKQYLEINDKPIIYYSLKAFEDSFIDEIVLVCGKGEEEFCRKEIVEKHSFKKVISIVEGGKERYHSVYNGLEEASDCKYIFIHDGARPFINADILNRLYDTVSKYGTAIAAMPVKDTIKIVDNDNNIIDTPDRNTLWLMQTPQVFLYKDIKNAYEKLIENEESILKSGISITDDAMVMENYGNLKVKICQAEYTNIKITTPEDLEIARVFLKEK